MDYYATYDDNLEVVRWLFDANELRIFETYSEYDRDLRELTSADEVRVENGGMLSLWAPTTAGRLEKKRIELKLEGYEFRYELRGWGLIGLQLGRLTATGLQASRVAANTEKRALAWEDTYPELGPAADWNWDEVGRVLRRISRWIRAQAVATEGGRPILPGAHAAREGGTPLLLR